jgi:hypothetical protein
MLGREFPSIRKVVSGRLDSSIVHASADTSSCLPAPTHLRSHRTGRSKPLSVPALDLPKTKRNHRRVKKGSSHGLTISPHSAPSFPFPTHAKSHNRNVSRYRSTTGIDTSTSSSVSDDTSFDHEEAILTQLLLRSLDSESRAGSGSGGGGGLELADMLSPPATHRFTQDSTSTGATLCESEMFKLKRGSVSTAFSSPPASPGGATGASRSEGS